MRVKTFIFFLFFSISVIAAKDFRLIIIENCIKHEVPYVVGFTVAMTESDIRMDIEEELNHNGTYDIGIFQLNSYYIGWFEEKYWKELESFNPYNPEHNIEMGIMYLSDLRKRFESWELAIRAYNVGPTTVWNNREAGSYYYGKYLKNVKKVDIKRIICYNYSIRR